MKSSAGPGGTGGPLSAPSRADAISVLKHSSYMPSIGGGEMQTHAIGRAMRRAGIRVRVIDTRGEGPRNTCQRLDGIPVLRYTTPGLPILDTLVQQVRLRHLLRRLLPSCDLVQVNHLSTALIPAYIMARSRRRPLLVLLWGSCRPGIGPFRRGWRWALLRALARRADHVLALSDGMAASLRDDWGFAPDRLEVIPNGVDITRFKPRRDLTPPSPLQGKGPVVISVGRLVPAKRYDLLIQAWSQVCRQQLEGHLVILGEGPLRRDLEALIQSLHLGSRVSLPGEVPGVQDWLSAAAVYVSSSDTEGMSNAILEALASALPVIATRVSGSTDLIQHGQQGLLVERDSPDALVGSIQRLLADTDERRRLGRNARARIVQSFSLEAVAARYQATYRRLSGRDNQPHRQRSA